MVFNKTCQDENYIDIAYYFVFNRSTELFATILKVPKNPMLGFFCDLSMQQKIVKNTWKLSYLRFLIRRKLHRYIVYDLVFNSTICLQQHIKSPPRHPRLIFVWLVKFVENCKKYMNICVIHGFVLIIPRWKLHWYGLWFSFQYNLLFSTTSKVPKHLRFDFFLLFVKFAKKLRKIHQHLCNSQFLIRLHRLSFLVFFCFL